MRQSYTIITLTAIAGLALYFAFLEWSSLDRSTIDQADDTVIIDMTTRSWRFDPRVVSGKERATSSSNPSTGVFVNSTIRVKLGSKVLIRLTNLEPNQPHGFALEEFGIQGIPNPPQQTVEVKFLANREGVFTFFCTVFCGTGHPQHRGYFIVER